MLQIIGQCCCETVGYIILTRHEKIHHPEIIAHHWMRNNINHSGYGGTACASKINH